MKIKIVVPKDGEKWKINIDKSHKRFINPGRLISRVESFLASHFEAKQTRPIRLIVDYDELHQASKRKAKNDRVIETGCEWFNDVKSNDGKALIYALKCFLEDYV